MDAATFLLFLIGMLLLAVAAPLGLWRWGRWVAQRHPGRAWRLVSRVPLAGLAFVLLGYAVGTVIVARTLMAAWGKGAETKAVLLSNGLAEALNCGAFFSLPAFPLCAVAALAFTVGSARRPARLQ